MTEKLICETKLPPDADKNAVANLNMHSQQQLQRQRVMRANRAYSGQSAAQLRKLWIELLFI